MLKRNKILTTILTTYSIIGVVGTAVLSAMATPKALKLIEEKKKRKKVSVLQKILIASPCYIPSALVAGTTIASILITDKLHAQNYALFVSAISSLDRQFKEYKRTLTDEQQEQAMKKIVERHVGDIPDESKPNGDKLLFYDTYGERYFNATMLEVIDAEYHTNRNFILRGSSTLNHFYEMLGLDPIPIGDIMGWDVYTSEVNDGMYWIDYYHELIKTDDGLECYVIRYPFEPYAFDDCLLNDLEAEAVYPVEFPNQEFEFSSHEKQLL